MRIVRRLRGINRIQMSLAVFLGLVAGQYIWRPYFVAIRQIADEERAKQKVDK